MKSLASPLVLLPLCLSSGAWAQDAPPMRHNVDENGVDVVLGTFNFGIPVVSIGGAGHHGLRQIETNAGGTWTDNHTGGVYTDGSSIFVSFGDTSEGFSAAGGGTFISQKGDGATLVRSGTQITYTTNRGVEALFFVDIDDNGQIVPGSGRLGRIRHPDGTTISYNYREEQLCVGQQCTTVRRAQSVTNNLRHMLKYTYARNDLPDPSALDEWQRVTSVKAINISVDPCDSLADSCSLTQSWPTASFSADHSQITLPNNGVWQFDGQRVRRPGATSDDLSYTFDASGRIGSVTGGNGTWTYGYSDAGTTRTTTVQGPLSSTVTYVSDTTREIVSSVTDANGHTTGFQYDSDERLTRITRDEGNYVQYTYDARGNVTETRSVAKSGPGATDIVSTAGYSSSCTNPIVCNLPNSTTDARGNTTDLTYDSTHGGILTITGPAPSPGAVRPQTRFTYTPVTISPHTLYRLTQISACQTQASCANATDEARTTISYPSWGFEASNTSSGNGSGTLTATTAFTYDSVGNLLTIDGPLAGAADTSRIRYNALRQPAGLISPDPDGAGALLHRAQRTTYDSAGLATAVEGGTVASQSDTDWANMAVLERVTIERDGLGRPTVQRFITGSTTHALVQVSYDAMGRAQCEAERMNPAEFSSLPSDACTLDTQGSFGPDRITRTTYDPASQVTLIQTGYGVTGVQADEVATSYTDNGEIETATDAENNRTTYVYDGHDRLSMIQFPTGTAHSGTSNAADFEQFSYDPNGNVTSRRLRDGNSIAFTFDTLNRPTFKNLPGSELDVTYTYDLLDRMTGATTSAQALSFTYDALGRNLTQVSPLGTATYQYDLAGRATRLTYPGSGLYLDYEYLLTNELRVIRENGATSGVGVLATYSYNNLGQRTSLVRGNGTSATYSYDAALRLSQLVDDPSGTAQDQTLAFTYNPAGQVTGTTRSNDTFAYTGHLNGNRTDTANGLNQLTAFGPLSMTHDARGNTTSVGVNVTFGYSAENLLTSFTVTPNSGSMAYDPLMRLLEATENGTATRFGYDGDSLIAEYSSGGALQRRFVRGPGFDEPLVWYEGSGTSDRRFLHSDERGSIVAVSNGSGAVTDVNTFDEYGIPAAANVGRFQYTGQPWLKAAGVYYYRARMYNPVLARFGQFDPIGYGAGMNLYAYVNDDPINFTDPLGLQPDSDDQEVVINGYRFGGGGGIGRSGNGNVVLPSTLNDILGFYQNPTGEEGILVLGRRRPELGWLSAIPGTQAFVCAVDGCSAIDWTWALTDFVPAARVFNLSRRGYRLLRVGCGCLEAGTLVATPDGLKAIETIAVGDMVMAMNEATGEIAPRQVTALVRPEPKPLYALQARDAGGAIETFHATDDHPWRVHGRGWVNTVDLRPGDRIDTATDEDLVITALVPTSRIERTYNLTVQGWHTFLVGEDRAVVHNACDLNKLRHIFGNAQHNLQYLVSQFGTEANAFAEIERATEAVIRQKGLAGIFEETVNVGGRNITVRGRVVNGVVRIGTAFQ